MPSLSETIENLEKLLFSKHLEEDALDYFGVHGLLCASIVGPIELPDAILCQLVFGDAHAQLSKNQTELFFSCIHAISDSIRESILQGNDIALPYSEEAKSEENNHYDTCLQSWCMGFMECFFYKEQEWFCKGEDVTAELLLPIMSLSGLFDSEDFNVLSRNNKLMSQFEEIMPEQLIDIFLFYHSE